jgi:uncharacterized protein
MSENLITALQNKALYDHPVDAFQMIETHCSWVILTGHFAYKIKKPVDFGFLNYTDLEKRKHFCEEELQRNQALAAQVYLNVVPIYGTDTKPSFNKHGDIIEYAVKMKEFSQTQILSQLQKQQKLNSDIINKLADNLAHFHLNASPVPTDSIIGSSEHAQQQARDNFTQSQPLLDNDDDIKQLNALSAKVETLYETVKPIIDDRKANGFVRQCHGDVHLNNIVMIDNNPVIFDCIDFNHDFCWTDTIADLAFITMDLDEFGEQALSWQLLNRYLEVTGDYAGLQLLPYFQAYRAMVRAKVALFTQQGSNDNDEKQQQYQRYQGCVALAESYLQARQQQLLITCGVSASGKSTLAKKLATDKRLIHISSDRERKRHAKIDAYEDCSAPVLEGLYQPAQTDETYHALLTLCDTIINANYPVIVDATFREQDYRKQFALLAKDKQVPFSILYCTAPEKQLRLWLNERQQKQKKLSEATQDVLTMQLEKFQSPLETEAEETIEIRTDQNINYTRIEKILGQKC